MIEVWPLTRAVQDILQVPRSHDRPVTRVVHNAPLGQLITLCSESVVKVWERDSGRFVYQISDAHGPNTELTALDVDATGYRLVTGAVDGARTAPCFCS